MNGRVSWLESLEHVGQDLAEVVQSSLMGARMHAQKCESPLVMLRQMEG